MVIAHRGASGDAYENSPAAFRAAVAQDADGIELDVHATSDDAIVVHHDAELPGRGAISSLPAREVLAHQLPNGERIPLLSDVFSILGDRDVWVEVKAPGPVDESALLQVLDAAPFPSRVSVHSFDHRTIARLGRLRPALPRGVLLVAYPVDPVAVMRAATAATLWQEWTMIDAELVEAVHAAGGRVIAWTVNDENAARRLTRLGVDGLCGNYLDRLRRAREAA
jgi:glycerophosphoryl diester phosphodiesterase